MEMPTMRQLKESAKDSAEWRGHKLTRFHALETYSAEAVCKVCGKGVVVNTRPMPNGITIAGEAVALNCE
jgi:hypothetical protein